MKSDTAFKPLPCMTSTPVNEKHRVSAIWRVVSMV
jgi:hypothetical protein